MGLAQDTVSSGQKFAEIRSRIREATLQSREIEDMIKCPLGVDSRDWIIANLFDFYSEITLLIGSLANHCTNEKCPRMQAGNERKKFTYNWVDPFCNSKQDEQNVSAPKYADLTLRFIHELLQERIPTAPNNELTPALFELVKVAFRRIFRLYAHVYFRHQESILGNSCESHLNHCFKHFIYFSIEHDLVPLAQLEPQEDIIIAMKQRDVAARPKDY